MIHKLYKLMSLVLLAVLVTACAPTEVVKTVEVVNTQMITQIVAGTPVTITNVVTATPAPTVDTSKQPVTLTFSTWTSNTTQLKLLSDIAAAYTATHPNVTI